ncbi:Uncharacterized conserved protein [Clostridium acidisoli DSM 12555]|jgi:hypothetical protein|uniref:Uncharacterized conserved protein n=1 Tax=Clostridium acidisoli DSM 12555 TaxID=1121291 RepID=A0A1W1XA96_9CLOT|nr:DUF4912 domain-containing protein [Clostridium acidisoli]SMC20734.1 Uncharacterized conserved protein [Clostridium acidisoli DSM 12555]
MPNDDNVTLTLLVQNSYTVFCYFNISPLIIKNFEDKNGEGAWKNSKPVLKVFEINNGISCEVKTIYLDAFANNWFINLDRCGVDLFVKLGRVLPDDTFISFAVSNTVTTPRDQQSNDTSVYYVDTSEKLFNETDKLPSVQDIDESLNMHKEPKPYPFMEQKKN